MKLIDFNAWFKLRKAIFKSVTKARLIHLALPNIIDIEKMEFAKTAYTNKYPHNQQHIKGFLSTTENDRSKYILQQLTENLICDVR